MSPSAMLEAPKPRISVGSSPILKTKYETTNSSVNTVERPNSVAT